MRPRYEIVQVGTAADGMETPLYQVFQMHDISGAFHIAELSPNDPVRYTTAVDRLCEARNAIPLKKGDTLTVQELGSNLILSDGKRTYTVHPELIEVV